MLCVSLSSRTPDKAGLMAGQKEKSDSEGGAKESGVAIGRPLYGKGSVFRIPTLHVKSVESDDGGAT